MKKKLKGLTAKSPTSELVGRPLSWVGLMICFSFAASCGGQNHLLGLKKKQSNNADGVALSGENKANQDKTRQV